MFHFSDRKELWRTRRLSWQKTESVDGLRLLETAGVSRGCNGHDAVFPSEVFVSFCPVGASEISLLPTLSCPGSVLLSEFSQWSHAPASCLCLCVLGVSPWGLPWLSSTPSSPPSAASLTFRSHFCRGNTLIRGCVGIAIRRSRVWNAAVASLGDVSIADPLSLWPSPSLGTWVV